MRYLKIITAAFTFAVLIYMSVFFGSYYTLAAFFCFGVVVILDILLFIIPFGTITAEIDSDSAYYKKGDGAEIYITIKSKKPFPIYRAIIDAEVKNRFYKKDNITFKTPLSILLPKKITLPVNVNKSGIVDISVTNIKYSDAFGIFYKNIELKEAYSIVVMPQNTDIDTKYMGSAESDEIPAVNVYLSNSGDVSGYKEYSPGDKTNGINWKLFARTNKLYVKEFERTSADEAVILMDMNIENLDKAIDIIYGIGCKNGVYTLLWLPCGNEEFESECISDEETLNNTLYKIFASAPEYEVNKGIDTYKRLYRENKVLYVSDKMELL